MNFIRTTSRKLRVRISHSSSRGCESTDICYLPPGCQTKYATLYSTITLVSLGFGTSKATRSGLHHVSEDSTPFEPFCRPCNPSQKSIRNSNEAYQQYVPRYGLSMLHIISTLILQYPLLRRLRHIPHIRALPAIASIVPLPSSQHQHLNVDLSCHLCSGTSKDSLFGDNPW